MNVRHLKSEDILMGTESVHFCPFCEESVYVPGDFYDYESLEIVLEEMLAEHGLMKIPAGEQPDVPDYEQTWKDEWRDIIYTDGGLSIDQVKRELHDYSFLMRQVGKVYDHVTGGRLSKTTYFAETVISEADRHMDEWIDTAVKEATEDGPFYGGKTWEYFRCSRCGRVEAPYQVEADDLDEPQTDCGCYMGPKWNLVTVALVPRMTSAEARTILRASDTEGRES